MVENMLLRLRKFPAVDNTVLIYVEEALEISYEKNDGFLKLLSLKVKQ